MDELDRANAPQPASPASPTLEDAVAALCDLVAVPSVSARGEFLREGADAIATLMQRCGLAVAELDSPGAPVVLGEIAAPTGAPTVLFYGHYDVQPPEPLEEWHGDPFRAEVRDGAVFGRGAGDNKGQLLAHLFAIRDLARSGALGVGVKVLVEGEEEIGSPTLGDVVRGSRERLRADLAVTADAALPQGDRPAVILGVRGLLYVEIEARGARSDLHSGNRGGLAPLPAWEMVRALAALREPGGRIAIPGFEDAVRAPDIAEAALLEALPFDLPALLDELGIDALPAGTPAGSSPWESLMFQPTLNIAGLSAGYGGRGAKTVIPARALCKLDMRLVADQDPDAIFDSLMKRVLEVAPGVEVRKLAAVPPSATPLDAPHVRTVIEAVARAAGTEPEIRPRMGGTTPDWVFTRLLEIPSVLIPYGPPDMSHHAPNERMTLAALERGIRCSTEILRAMAV